MRKWSIETLSLAGIGGVLLLLAALATLAWRDTQLSQLAARQVDQAYARVSWLEQLRAEVYRTESEQRHYLAYPNEDNRVRRDSMLAALERQLAPGAGPLGASAAGLTQLAQLRLHIRRQMTEQAPGAARDVHAGAFQQQAEALADGAVGAERTQLAQVKQVEAARNLQARVSLVALLLTLSSLIISILLRMRAVTISRRAAYTLLQSSATRYRQIVETAHEGIWLTDARGEVTFANQRAAAMLGCPAPALVGRSVYDFLDEHRSLGACAIFGGDGASPLRDLRYRRDDASVAWAMVGGRLLHDEHGRIAGALVMATDITERKLAEQALCIAHAELENRIRLRTAELVDANTRLRAEVEVRRAAEQALASSEQRLQEIISMMPLALFLKDADSRIVLMNEACEQQWGVRFADLAGTSGNAHFPPEQIDAILVSDRAAFARRQLLVEEEVLWNARMQENRRVQTYKKPIFDAAGRPQLLIAMGIDVTDSRRNEEALRHSLLQLRELSDHQETIKEEERKRIARDIHDDLGQNLMALKIDVTMLHARTGQCHPRLNQQVQRALETIDGTIKSVRSIINDLHPSTLELGLCAAVDWLLKQFERRSTIRYRLTILDDSANASLDQRQTLAMFRVVQESLSNIVRHAQASEVDVSLNLHPCQIAIVIADNGIGMQPGDRGKASSYGLKSIQERIDAFGGELSIDSRSGKGTVLSIAMPVTVPARQGGRRQSDRQGRNLLHSTA